MYGKKPLSEFYTLPGGFSQFRYNEMQRQYLRWEMTELDSYVNRMRLQLPIEIEVQSCHGNSFRVILGNKRLSLQMQGHEIITFSVENDDNERGINASCSLDDISSPERWLWIISNIQEAFEAVAQRTDISATFSKVAINCLRAYLATAYQKAIQNLSNNYNEQKRIVEKWLYDLEDTLIILKAEPDYRFRFPVVLAK